MKTCHNSYIHYYINTALFVFILMIHYGLSPLHASNIRLESNRLSVINGMPGNTVNDIRQDKDGYIWLGTVNGMSRYDGYSFVNFSKFDRDISQIMNDDKHHVMWGYSSRQILCCYDMQKAQILTYEDTNKDSKLLSNRFMSSNGIWLFSGDFGVRHLIYENGRFHATDYTTKNGGIVGDRSLHVEEDNKQNIWISSNKGLNRVTPDGKSHVMLKGKDIVVMTCDGFKTAVLSKDGDAYIYNHKGQLIKKSHLGSMTGFVGKSRASMFWKSAWYIFTQAETFAMDLKTGVFFKPKEQIVNAMDKNPLKSYKFFYDKEGNVYIFGKKSQLFRKFNLISNKSIIGARDKNFVAAEDAQGRIFIASYGNGLFVYNPKDDKLQHFSAYDKEPLFHTDFLLNVFIDKLDCIWVGTTSGMYQLRELKGLDYEIVKLDTTDLRDEWSNTVRHISDLGNDCIAISSKVNKTYIYNLRTHQAQHIIKTDACVYCYAIAPDGKAWIGTKGDGMQIDGIKYSKYEKGEHYIPTLSFYDIVFDKYGRSWMATWGEGLLLGKLNAQRLLKYQQFLNNNGNESQIHDLVPGKNGQLWIACNNGIILANTLKKQITEKDFIKFNKQDGSFPANKVNCGICSHDGSLWFGTNRGVFKCTYDEKSHHLSYQHFDTTNGLISNMVTSIVQDAYHNIWIGTEEGLTLLNAKTGDMRTIKFSSSLQENYIAENCAIRLKDGRLAFGAASGILLIKPHKASMHKEPDLKVTITDLTINGLSVYDEQQESLLKEALDYTQEISLPHDKNSLSIYFSNFDYPNIKSTMYQYYLEGIDHTWRPATSINHADFSDLNPGHYTLHLRTLLGNNQWSKETKLKIAIREPWYNSWWAWLIYLLLIGGISYLFYRSWRRNFDLNQEIKMEKEMSNFRIEFFTHISHEFRTPLAIIQSAVEKISDSESGYGNKNALLTLQRGNKRLQRLINQLMEFRKANTGNMKLALEENDIVAFTRNIYNDLRQVAVQKEINISFTPWANSYRMYFDSEKVETIIYNLLSNAVKYTPDKGSIEVTLSLNNQGLCLTVEDNGPGIRPEREKDLFKPFMHGNVSKGGMGIGLYNAYEMANLHKGSLTYQRSQRKEHALGGSLFTLLLPTNKEVYQPEDFTQHIAIDQDSMNKEEIDMIVKEMTPEAINQITVMVIEDDPDMMEQIKSELATYFRVVAYMNGKTGYENIKKVKPALLISDIMLPGMSGYEIVSNMKADPETQNIPVIMLTAFDDTNHILKAYKNFVDDYMVKPCNFKLLIARALQFVTMDIKAKEMSLKEKEATVTSTAAPEEKKNMVMTSVQDKKFKDKIEAIIAQHISDQNFNVDRLAELLNLGRTTIYSRTKAVLGMSPNVYIQNERLRIAANLLLEGQYTIAEISDKVGFSDSTYFYKCFKNKYGVAPSKYGKQ